ncbi:MAG: septum formation initiator family protein [candidate division WOR-3 bacterium]|nr:MAG: septum formation initiator family protein [candidate division WOR-3 bacterium]
MKRRRKRAKKRYGIIAMIIILSVPLFYLGRRVYKFAGVLLEEKELEKKKIVLQAENDVMMLRVEEYRKGVLTETKAREDLGMIREGEKVFLVPKK